MSCDRWWGRRLIQAVVISATLLGSTSLYAQAQSKEVPAEEAPSKEQPAPTEDVKEQPPSAAVPGPESEPESDSKPTTEHTDRASGEAPAHRRGFSGSLYVGYTLFEWEPGFDTSEPAFENQLFDYTAEGLEMIDVRLDLAYRAIEIGSFAYQGPLESTERQSELYDAYESSGIGFAGQLALRASTAVIGYTFGLYDDTDFAAWVYGVALSMEYQRIATRFFVDATARESLEYVLPSGVVNRTIGAGQAYEFYSNVESNSLTIDLFGNMLADFGSDVIVWNPIALLYDTDLMTFVILNLLRSPQLRVGFFSMDYQRPTNFGMILTRQGSSLPAALAARYSAFGYEIQARRARRDLPGFNLDITYRYSIEASVTAAYTPEGSEIVYESVVADFWYRLPIMSAFHLVAGYRYEAADWLIDEVIFDQDGFGIFYASATLNW